LIIDSTTAKNKAEKNPDVLNPSIILSTKSTIKTLIINDIKPSVKKLTGNVRIRNIVPMVAFARASSIPAIRALKNPSTCTPGIRYAAIKTATPISKISIINFIFFKIRLGSLIIVCCLNILLSACHSKTEKADNFKTIKIELNADSSKIILKGLEHNIIESLNNDTLRSEEWQSLFAIYAKPRGAEESLSEPIQGKYMISNNDIIFLPDSSFEKGHTYDAVFTYPQYYSTSSALSYKTLPGKLATIENHFDF
jgi:hypothetical protein